MFSLSLENSRQETTSAESLLSPQYATGLTLSARQPLLKNRGRQVTEAPLRIARAGAEEKTEEWKSKVMDTVSSVRTAYLAFFSAAREEEVREAALELAERMIVHTDARIQGGAAAEMDRLPAESAVATRREELLRAQAAVRSAEADLKIILGVRSERDWGERLAPIPPMEDISPPGAGDTFEEAIRMRPEVAAMKAKRTQSEIREVAARNQTLPSLDLTASAGLAGLSGTPNPDPLFAGNAEVYTGNYGDSVDRLFSGKYHNWQVGLKTEIPWGMQREKAEWARAKAALREQRLLEEAVFLRIRGEVWKARVELESAVARIDATRTATVAAEKKLEAEEKKLSVGRSTTVEVLRFQQDLSEARLAEVRARSDAHGAQTRL
ncbi:MAG: TolC family protein, partial [Desulfobacterales bacterium]|nr:TolC family protein [Desulfobacterales bacterium]